MEETAEPAGISKLMLYSYFGSKEGLYFASVNLAYNELVAAFDLAVASAPPNDPEEQLRAGSRAYYQYIGEHRHSFRALFREVGDPGGELARQRHRLSRRDAADLEQLMLAPKAPPSQVEGRIPLARGGHGA